MKIAAWNVNSVRARLERLVGWLERARPDVVCLQELKCTQEEFPWEPVRAAGYHAVVHGQKTYNGVAILSRTEPQQVVYGLRDGEEDPQARLVAATVGGVRVLSVYAPNGQQVGSEAYGYKLRWYGRLRHYLERHHRPQEPLVLGGDWNVAPQPIDVHDPQAWEGQLLCSEPERAALRELCSFGLVDTFRQLHPDEQRFSWWDYRMLAFPKNKGLRIDHIFATAPLAERLVAAGVDRDERKGKQPSDHAPVWAELRG